jgi:tetratricopeptide (TPR) repeat protein
MASTGEQLPVDAESVRARIDERIAAQRTAREAAGPPTEPEKARPALSAADLEAIRWRLDGGTLREVVDNREALHELGERLDGPLADEVDNVAKAGLLSVRAEVYRLLGELGMAAAASRLALAHAESARDLQSEVIAQAELAHILRLRGDFKEADRLFAKATGADVPETLRSVVHENAGRSCFDQGRHMEALDHFARAVRLGGPDDSELAARVGVCLQAVYIHVLRDGWGPYPRTREDILGLSKPAEPATKETTAFDEPTAEREIIQPR